MLKLCLLSCMFIFGCVADVLNGTYIAWDDKIEIKSDCRSIWEYMSDYKWLIKIVFPFVDPVWGRGKAKEVGGTVVFEIDNAILEEQIVAYDDETMYLSFVLTAGFDIMTLYRGTWYLVPIEGNDDLCEFHKGSYGMINAQSTWTPQSYKQTIMEELHRVKEYFENKQDL